MSRRHFIARGGELLFESFQLLASPENPGEPKANLGGFEAALRGGQIFLQGKRLSWDPALASQLLKPGETLSLGLPKAARRQGQPRLSQATPTASSQLQPPGVNTRSSEARLLSTRFGLGVAFKPAGLPSEPGQSGNDSLVSRVAALTGAPVHAISRLDQEVSGCLLLALTDAGRKLAARLLSEGAIERRYLGVCEGAPEPRAGRWDMPIGDGPRGLRQIDGRNAKPAITHYHALPIAPLKRCAEAGLDLSDIFSKENTQASPSTPPSPRSMSPLAFAPSLLELQLETGRTHQIRVHCAAAGTPLLGDRRYGGRTQFSLESGSIINLPVLALHAYQVSVRYRGERWLTTAPLPTSWNSWLQHLPAEAGAH